MFNDFSIFLFSAVPDEMIARLFAAFASLKQKIVFKFDSIKVSNCNFFIILCFAWKASVTMPGRYSDRQTGTKPDIGRQADMRTGIRKQV